MTPARTRPRPIRLLHADDEPGFAEVVAETLPRVDGSLTVVPATDAAAALELLDRDGRNASREAAGAGPENGDGDGDGHGSGSGTDDRIDCVVSDYDLAGTTGVELLKAVRERRPDLPFVLFTRRPSAEVASEAFAAGADGYLRKEPGVDGLATLAALVRGVVDAAGTERDAEFDRYERVFDSMGDGVYELDAGGRIVACNRAVGAITGRDPEDLVGEHVSALLPAADIDRCEAGIRELLHDEPGEPGESGEPGVKRYEIDLRRADGERVPCELSLTLLPRGPDGSFRGTVGVVRDVSERVRMEATLRADERAFRRLSEAASRTDLSLDEKLPRVLSAGCERLGVANAHLTRIDPEADRRTVIAAGGDGSPVAPGAVEPLSGSPCRETIAGDGLIVRIGGGRTDPAVGLGESTGDGVDSAGDGVDSAPDAGFGTYVGTRVVVDGEPFGTLCLVDPEPREPLSAAERSFVSLLAQWVRSELERAEGERRLERENERLDEFAGVVGHDLRNPLDVITLNLELAREEPSPERLDAIERAAARIDELAAGLLALARQGRVVGETEPVAVADAARTAWGHVDTAGGTLVVADGLGTVAADRPRLVQLFENLFRNCVEHGSSGGRPAAGDGVEHRFSGSRTDPDGPVERGAARSGSPIGESVEGVERGSTPTEDRDAGVTVTVGPLSDEVGFYVADDGAGIRRSERSRVFESGYTTAADGTGFGLAIVKSIVEAHGWSVSVVGSADGGARFEVATAGEPTGVPSGGESDADAGPGGGRSSEAGR